TKRRIFVFENPDAQPVAHFKSSRVIEDIHRRGVSDRGRFEYLFIRGRFSDARAKYPSSKHHQQPPIKLSSHSRPPNTATPASDGASPYRSLPPELNHGEATDHKNSVLFCLFQLSDKERPSSHLVNTFFLENILILENDDSTPESASWKDIVHCPRG